MFADGAAWCADCLTRKTGVPRVEIPTVIQRVRERFRAETPPVACAVCCSTWKVYRMIQNANPESAR